MGWNTQLLQSFTRYGGGGPKYLIFASGKLWKAPIIFTLCTETVLDTEQTKDSKEKPSKLGNSEIP